jgi:hypothetical protein
MEPLTSLGRIAGVQWRAAFKGAAKATTLRRFTAGEGKRWWPAKVKP